MIPCSGIGKVHGLVSREAVYRAIGDASEAADTVCLALLVTGDAETKQKVQQTPCITVNGCPSSAHTRTSSLSGGKITEGIRVYDTMKRHRGADFGSPTALSAEGWLVVEELAAEAVQAAKRSNKL